MKNGIYAELRVAGIRTIRHLLIVVEVWVAGAALHLFFRVFSLEQVPFVDYTVRIGAALSVAITVSVLVAQLGILGYYSIKDAVRGGETNEDSTAEP